MQRTPGVALVFELTESGARPVVESPSCDDRPERSTAPLTEPVIGHGVIVFLEVTEIDVCGGGIVAPGAASSVHGGTAGRKLTAARERALFESNGPNRLTLNLPRPITARAARRPQLTGRSKLRHREWAGLPEPRAALLRTAITAR